MTSFFAWNMRGFNKPRKHEVLRRWLKHEKPAFGCLLETRVQENNHQQIFSSCFPGWNSITNYDFHRLGRIWFCWTDNVNVTLLHKSSQQITCGIQIIETGITFICTAVYASNFSTERSSLWSELRAINSGYVHSSIPWILIGDYNEILSTAEHSRALDYSTSQLGMRQFQDLVTHCDLMDMSSVGSQFTWWNKRSADPIGKKIRQSSD